MERINRDALSRHLYMSGPVELAKSLPRLGYVRGRFNNGLEVIATKDGGDWIMQPSFSMRQADAYYREWEKLPVVNMGR